MTNRLFRSVIVVLAMGLTASAITLPASASDDAAADDAHGRNTIAQSALEVTNFKAGYLSTVSTGDLKAAEATFVVPALTCSDKHEVVAMGIGNEPSSGIFQWLSIVWLTCEDGEASYDIRSRVGSSLGEGVASAGDEIRASVRRATGGWTQVTTTNLTTGEAVYTDGTVLPDEFANVVDFGTFPVFLRKLYPVPEFVTAKLSSASVTSYSTGRTCLGNTDPIQYTRADKQTGEVEIDTSPVRGCRFALKWRSH